MKKLKYNEVGRFVWFKNWYFLTITISVIIISYNFHFGAYYETKC